MSGFFPLTAPSVSATPPKLSTTRVKLTQSTASQTIAIGDAIGATRTHLFVSNNTDAIAYISMNFDPTTGVTVANHNIQIPPRYAGIFPAANTNIGVVWSAAGTGKGTFTIFTVA